METKTLEEAKTMIGQESGVSEWVEMSQERINQFADVTEDHQFIHINPEMAKMTPFGGTVAHGFLTLSMLAKMGEKASVVLEGTKMGVNYGFDKIRFLAPVPSGAKIRGRFIVAAVDEKRPGQTLITYDVSVEIEGGDKPALIAQWMGMQFSTQHSVFTQAMKPTRQLNLLRCPYTKPSLMSLITLNMVLIYSTLPSPVIFTHAS